MIVASLLGLSLALTVSLDTQAPPVESITSPARAELSAQQKEAVLLPLVRRATKCILRKASINPRFRGARHREINDIILDSMAACATSVRTMMEAHDRLYGDGSGEAFLLGPYLDVLPSAMIRQVRTRFK